ncbi:DUF6418 domain-containing protein [Bilifractor sp. LCP19S3_H10]|uniref:DUF6418 domain-containing protein n=1 Tax=Bilifractor sp. LCP19S3_H10 TaxID=3438736 RepID=UPI003F8EB55F
MIRIKKQTRTFMTLQAASFVVALLNFIPVLDWLLIAFFICEVIYIAIREHGVFLKYLYFLVLMVWNTLCVFCVDNFRVFLPNLLMRSYRTGALAPLVIANNVFLLTILLLENNNKTKKVKQLYNDSDGNVQIRLSGYKRLISRVIAIGAIIVAVIFLNQVLRNNYYTSGYSTRFEYMQNSNAIALKYFGYLPYLIPFFLITEKRRINKKLISIYVVLYIAFLLLIGQKFTPIFELFTLLILCYLIPFYNKRIEKNYKKIFIYLILIAVAFVFFSGIQSIIERGSSSIGIAMLFNRIINGQGDVWWGIYAQFSNQPPHLKEISDELSFIGNTSNDQLTYNFGIYKMMNLIAPRAVLESYARKGARFTASTNASIYYYFGIVGLLTFQILFAIVIWYITNKIIVLCAKGKAFETVLWCFLRNYSLSIYMMSAFDLFFRNTTKIIIFLIIISYFYNYLGRKTKRSLNAKRC